ncbi:MAG: hypothetical protein Q8K87_08110 [Hydrogenophaga sp.]|nr:hypothetical protein [Hydrogenophaga sp.]
MGMGSTLAVEDAEEECREQLVNFVASTAAERVGARDLTRPEAIAEAVKHASALSDADNDPTGTLGTLAEAQAPKPSRVVSDAQRKAIAIELIEATRDAVGAGGRFSPD